MIVSVRGVGPRPDAVVRVNFQASAKFGLSRAALVNAAARVNIHEKHELAQHCAPALVGVCLGGQCCKQR